jgi:hypothetical protein
MSRVMLDNVRKLLAKAEHPACTAEEAAADLIAKYGVDRALLARQGSHHRRGGRPDRAGRPAVRSGQDQPARLGLAALRCRSVIRESESAGRRVFSVHLFGFGSDLERVELLFTSLLVQAGYGLAATAPPPLEAWPRSGGPG